MDPCLQENRLDAIERTLKEMVNVVNEMNVSVNLIREQVKITQEKVDGHDDILLGHNGNPGLVANVSMMMEVLIDFRDVMRGKGKEPGLIAVIADLAEKNEDRKDTNTWAFRLIVGAVITQVIIAVVSLLK